MRLGQVYWDVFLIAFTAIALWESYQPRRESTRLTVRRWGRNGILAAMTDAAGLLLRLTPIAVAAAVADTRDGLLNGSFAPLPLRIVVSVLILDFVRYLQHRGMHAVGAFWRLHQVHHSDDHVDLTTGLRFHPGEMAVTQICYLAIVALLAPPVVAVMIADFALMVQNLFTHANVCLPAALERRLRMVLVTPEMHRVHHSVRRDEQNANFGGLFPFWDRACGTYRAAPADAEDRLRFGLQQLHSEAPPSLFALLRMPFAIANSRGRVQRRPEGGT
jgi:sterol desaturase/sphingolipid hydroxylase (fatty acid hydroxylase superfamily)